MCCQLRIIGWAASCFQAFLVATGLDYVARLTSEAVPHQAAVFYLTTRRTHFISSLIASWLSKIEQTQAQSGSETIWN